MDTFWFYDIDLNYEFMSKLCPTSVIVNTINRFGKVQDTIPKDVTETLNEIKCLQTYLKQEQPAVIDFDSFSGQMNHVLVKKDNSFYYVMGITDFLVVIGVNNMSFVRYEIDCIKQHCTTSFKHLTYGKDLLDNMVSVEKDLQDIYSILFPKAVNQMNRLEVFNE